MNGFYDGLLRHAGWLYEPFYANSLFFFDYWSVAHFLSGMGLMVLLTGFRARFRWLFLLGILLLYEILEILFMVVAFNLFLPETLKDQVTDLVAGMVGGFLAFRIIFWVPQHTPGRWLRRVVGAFFLSFTLAFAWAGNNPEEFSTGQLREPVFATISFWTWLVAGMLILIVHDVVAMKKTGFLKSLLLCWLVWAGIFSIILAVTGESLSGMTWVHYAYYICFPAIIIIFQQIADRLIERTVQVKR